MDAATLAQPIPFDATGDMRTDLLGLVPDASGNKKSFVPRVWSNVWDSSNRTRLFNLSVCFSDIEGETL